MTGSNWDFSKYAPVEPGQGADSRYGGETSAAPTSGSSIDASTADYDFGPAGIEVTSPLRVGRPPVLWLVACLLVVISAALLAWRLGDSRTWAVVAWVASGPIAVGLLAAFSVFDTRARARAAYSRPAWVGPTYVACLVLSGVAVCVSSLRIALWVGRL